MSSDNNQITALERQSKNSTGELVSTKDSAKKNQKTSPQLFLQLAKQFAIEGALLPTEKQMPIEERHSKRTRIASLRKQQNIETIIQKTLSYCANKDISQKTDLDWVSQYIDLAQGISNTTMQDLWAKILAGELSRPGTFSLKALKTFREMSIFDAKLLAKACAIVVKDSSKKNIRILSGSYQQTSWLNFFAKNRQQSIDLAQAGLNYTDILALAENNLVFCQENESSLMAKGESLKFNYNGLNFTLTSKVANVTLQFYKFTAIGVELASLISDRPDHDIFTEMKNQLGYHFEVSDA